ncbi:MAG: hypothetical protein WC087_04085 [Candidatus Paceibacterota bacterium]
MFFQKYKKIILGVLLLSIAFVLYSTYFGGEPEGEELLVSSNTNTSTQTQIVGNEIVAALNQIQTLKLNRDIFDDPVFRSLVDRNIPIPAEPVGKTNPFAPIGADFAAPATTRPSTQNPNTLIDTTKKPPANQPVI